MFHRLFYPQVPVVITAEFQGTIGAMPAIWCMPLSFKPPLVGVAVAPDHQTHRLIIEAKSFCVNWLDFSHAKQIGGLGDISGSDQVNKLSLVGLTAVKGTRTSQPLVKEAAAVLECRLLEKHRTGSHELVIGKVESAIASECFDNYWDFAKYDPPLYAGTVDGERKSWVFISTHGKTRRVPLKQ
jgi:flavin reductase (DIM6/NTAB) family NADH-FMN oxidoreductase RutF